MASPAVSAVFNTTELLEGILVKLPPVERLAARRVCRLFQTCITNSPDCWKPIFLNNDEEEWWAIHRVRQEIIRVAPETDRSAYEPHGWVFVRPALLNGIIFEETWSDTAERCIFSAYDARARVKLELAKVNDQSLCTWLPLLYGTRATGKVFFWTSSNPADLDDYEKPCRLIVFPTQLKDNISMEFSRLCSAVAGWNTGIQVRFANTIIVTEEMLHFVRKNGQYKLPFIARESQKEIIGQIASHLNPRDLRNFLTCCNEIKRMMHREEVESTLFTDSTAYAKQKVLADMNISPNAVLMRLDNQFATSAMLCELQVMLHQMNRKSEYGRISSGAHFALREVMVFNENIFERCFGYSTAAQQAKAGFAFLQPAFSPEKRSSDDDDQTVYQAMVKRTDTYITSPPTSSIELEVVVPVEGKVWTTTRAEGVSNHDAFVTVGQLFATMIEYNGTGRVRIPGAILAKQEEWMKLQTLPVLAEEDVKRFKDSQEYGREVLTLK
ncbi:hypothetical protein AC578_931 [Pseudocercospora eumusae]|uniref:F-box domain-containing protein n=1 Tax=Pseudocercospora eumusae TaxID=321146 RepID=A0A139HBV4_9PEZI|nr:hypothetical protein AC578_931 [Pseudocercospora eumusae]